MHEDSEHRDGAGRDAHENDEPRVVDAERFAEHDRTNDTPATTPGPQDDAALDPPEGHAPEHAPNPRQISGLLVSVSAGLVVLGLVLGIAVRPAIGVGLAALGVILVVFNPLFWASLLRAKDRVDAGGRR